MITEHVDDIPMLLAQMDRIGLVEVLDAHVPIHDNWQESSCGRVTTVFLDPHPAELRGSAAAKESGKHDAHHFA